MAKREIMKRTKRIIMKRIIGALKEKCYSVEDLKGFVKEELPKLSPDALRKRFSRYLEELDELGLLKERGDKYCWYIYINDFNDREDGDAKLLHSQRLVPALRRIAGITWPRYAVARPEEFVSELDMEILEKCAEDHLRAYPEIWRFLEDSKRIREKVERRREMFCTNLTEKLRKEFGKDSVVKPIKESRYPSFVGTNIPLLICNHLLFGSPTRLRPEGEKMWFGDRLVAKGSHLFNSISTFINHETNDEFNIKAARQIKKIEGDAFKSQQKLQQEIRKLILRIESGEPLLGGCKICPKVHFSNTRHIGLRDDSKQN